MTEGWAGYMIAYKGYLYTSHIDTANPSNPATISKIDLNTFTKVGTLVPDPNVWRVYLSGAEDDYFYAIDSTLGTPGPSYIYKIDANTFQVAEKSTDYPKWPDGTAADLTFYVSPIGDGYLYVLSNE